MIPLNMQPIEKPVKREDGMLDVISIFRTMQGEGPFSGQPAIFIRLAGCVLDCPLCDTNYTLNRRLYSTEQIVAEVKRLCDPPYQHIKLVVLTGGEPLRQRLTDLISALYGEYQTQIETNGTLDIPWIGDRVSIVCSPKTHVVHKKLIPYISCFKYVVEAGQVDSVDGLPLSVLGKPCQVARPPNEWLERYGRSKVYIQPCDEGEEGPNKANRETAVQVCMQHGYTLSLQTHKLLGLE